MIDPWYVSLLGALPSAFSGGGITGGAVLGIFGRLIATEKIWFNRSVQRVIDEKDKQLADLREQTNLRITEKDGELVRMKEELSRMTADRDHWRAASDTDRARADVATETMTRDFLPLLTSVNRTFKKFTDLAEGQPG